MSPTIIKLITLAVAVAAFVGSAFVEGVAHEGLLAIAGFLSGGVLVRRPGDALREGE